MRWFGFTGWMRARRARRARERLERLDRATIGAEEYRLCDGDVVPFPGYPRWTDLVTRELPELAPPSMDGPLVRPYVPGLPAGLPEAASEHSGRHRRRNQHGC